MAAAFLLDKVVFHPAGLLRRREDILPGRRAFSEQNPVALLLVRGRARSPVLQVEAIDAARIGVDPRDRVAAHFHARTYVELQHDIFRRIGGDHFDGPLAVHRFELRLVIVIAGAQSRRTQLLHRLGEGVANALPAVEPRHNAGTRHHDIPGAQRFVVIDRLLYAFGTEVARVIVRRVAANAGIFHHLADVFDEIRGPGVVGTIELDHFVSHPGDGTHRGQGIFGHLVADRIECDADWYVLAGGRAQGNRSRPRCSNTPPPS